MDYLRFVDGVPFLDLNSTTHFWCAESHRLFPEAVYREARLAGNTVIYDEPVHAVITLQSDGLIEIAGLLQRPAPAGAVCRESPEGPRGGSRFQFRTVAGVKLKFLSFADFSGGCLSNR